MLEPVIHKLRGCRSQGCHHVCKFLILVFKNDVLPQPMLIWPKGGVGLQLEVADLFINLINSAWDVSLKSTQGSATKLVSIIHSIIGHDGIILLNRSWKKSTDTGSIYDPSIRCLWARFCIPYEEVSLSKTLKPELAPEASSVCEHACVVITACWMAVNVSVNGCKQTDDTPSAQRYLQKQHIGTFS